MSPVITGGYVQGGGAICMELLTHKGWCSTYTIEKIILQITTTIVSVSINFSRREIVELQKRTFTDIEKKLITSGQVKTGSSFNLFS